MSTISDINAEARSLCDADTTSYPAPTLLRRINLAYETVIGWLLNADGTWQFDDENFTTNPVGTTDLISAQTSYSFADKFLDLLEVDILGTDGIYHRITPFDPSEVGMSFEEYFNITTSSTPTGFPQYYDKVGNTIKLDKSPTAANVTLVAGIKVKFKRTADLFTSAQVTTGTKEPGFASPWHYILSYMAAIPYCQSYKKDRVSGYEGTVRQMRDDLLRFYGRREKDKRKVMTLSRIKFR